MRCGQSGYKGRTGLYEVMTDDRQAPPTDPRQGQAMTSCGQWPESWGCGRFARTGSTKIQRGITSIPEVLRVVGIVDG